MRIQSWRNIASTVLGLFVAGMRAQGSLQDLGSLLAENQNLTSFYSMIQKYPQILLQLPSESGVTILAPNNDAFNKIPYTILKQAFQNNDEDVITNIILYHILQGTLQASQLIPGTPEFIPTLLTSQNYTNVTGGQRVEIVKQAGNVVVFVSGQGSRSTLVEADLTFNGGVVQVIDSLLIAPAGLSLNLNAFNLTAFEGALYAASLIETTSNTHNVTIFAPSNSAFQALGPSISTMTSSELSTVLDYHILSDGVVYSTGLTNGSHFNTAQGGNISVTHSGNSVYINSAQLVTSDILIANGVLHVIDNVLNWQTPGAKPNPQLATQAPAFASASQAGELPFTSDIPCTSACPVTTTSTQASTTEAGTTSIVTVKGFKTSSSKGAGPRETVMSGIGGLMIALGGAAMLI